MSISPLLLVRSKLRFWRLLLAVLCAVIPSFVSAQSFTILDTPNPNSNNNHLKGVAALSSTDVWAVGFYTDNAAGAFLNLAMHWNGSSWTITPTPNPSQPYTDQLKKVAAVASNDVWAVGGHGLSVILHWNGAQWTQVPRPPVNFNPQYTNVAHDLDDIAAISSNDIWAVGWLDAQNGGSITLTMHWDGTQWTQIPSPNVPMPSGSPYSQRLEAVAAIASNDVWAVGFYRIGNTEHPLILHWNGTQWSLVPAPNGPATAQAPSGDGWLHGIAAAGPNDIWAVGEYDKVDFNTYAKPFAMHWDGVSWTVVLPPNPGYLGVAPLNSVVARGPNDFFAVGELYNSSQGFNTFVLHWNGSAWTQVPSENPPGTGTGWNQLHDVARDSSGRLWTVGVKQASFGSPNYTLVERSPAVTPVTLTSVVSTKSHNGQPYGVALPLNGTPGVESRDAGTGEHTLIFSFAQSLAAVGAADVSSGTGEVSGSGKDPTDARRYIVNLSGVSNGQRITVSLMNVSDSAGNNSSEVAFTMDVLEADLNGDRRVNVGDTNQARAQSGQATNNANCRFDVNLDGRINVGDTNFVRARSGNVLTNPADDPV